MAVPPQSVIRVLPRAWGTGGTARPHLLRISAARKFVVAVTGEQCVLLNVRYARIATKSCGAANDAMGQ
jgi:hypothetical protein